MQNAAKHDLSQYPMPQGKLDGKIILVTGAGSGIGAAAARHYAKLGATVILLGRTQAKLEAIYDQIVQDSSPEPVILPFDLAETALEPFSNIASAIEQQFGKLDGLLNAAAVLGQLTPIASYNSEAWQQVFDINVHGLFKLTRVLIPLLQLSTAGRIIHISSSVGREGRANWGAYAASKFAVEGLSQTLSDELKDISTITSNCYNPGRTRTAMRAQAFPAEDPATLPAPEAHLAHLTWLMSEDSEGFSGQTVDYS